MTSSNRRDNEQPYFCFEKDGKAKWFQTHLSKGPILVDAQKLIFRSKHKMVAQQRLCVFRTRLGFILPFRNRNLGDYRPVVVARDSDVVTRGVGVFKDIG